MLSPAHRILIRIVRQESKKMKQTTLMKRYRQMDGCKRQALKRYGVGYQKTVNGQFSSNGNLKICQQAGPGLNPVVRSDPAMTRYQESCPEAGDAG
jgi:hypothetical protein